MEDLYQQVADRKKQIDGECISIWKYPVKD